MSKENDFYALGADFFESRAVKRLRMTAGGDTFTIIYLRMLALASMNKGRIISEHIGCSLTDEIAIELGESKDNVNMALFFLKDCGLIDIKPDQISFYDLVNNKPASEQDAQSACLLEPPSSAEK